MWTCTLNWNVVRRDLVIGSCPRSSNDLNIIQAETQVTAMLSLQHDECLEALEIDYPRHLRQGRALGLVMTRCPLRDFDPDDQRRGLPSAVRALTDLLRRNHRVYVHCTAGINRASLVVVSYLTWIEGASLEEAMKSLLHARPEIFPTWEAYHGCREDLTLAHEERIRRRAFELSRERPEREAWENWLQAEQEIRRDIILADERPHGTR
ncbi:MAG: dual specificity protein phosphatase family protein [Candidatus Competibacteraceae bacterium]|nr:dual specificity protein phosphatase family protein [Candidatus Competibacteraceae bacterium]